MPRIIFYDEDRFRPIPHRARLHKPGEERHWAERGWWPVGLDWRPGAPTFLSNLSLTTLYRHLVKAYDLDKLRNAEGFQLQVVPLTELGEEVPDRAFFFIPTAPIDDEDEEAYRRWQSAA